MPLLNYTTQIDPDRTITEITKMLVKFGAQKIMTDYDGAGHIIALSFIIDVEGQPVGFKLPTYWQPILTIINNDPKVPGKLKTNEQALRIAWRIIKDWVEAQLAIIEVKMVKPEQVFLPYMMQQNGKTHYENAVENKFLLPTGAQND